MRSKAIIEEKKTEKTIETIPKEAFTELTSLHARSRTAFREGLDFLGTKEDTQPQRTFQTGLMYTRIKPYSTLASFNRCSEGRFTDYRRATDQERKTFGSPMIAVLRKREKQEDNEVCMTRASEANPEYL
jgi:hypothetical protein